MSLQVFLQAQLLGAEKFLTAEGPEQASEDDLIGRCAWLTLLGEVIPRALLAELKLSRMLLGSSSAEQFFLVLAEDDIGRANEFLTRADQAIFETSAGTLRLLWASTENLGTWPVARKRLDDALSAKMRCPLADRSKSSSDLFTAYSEALEGDRPSFFAEFAKGLVTATSIGWSREHPAQLSWTGGTYTWPLHEQSTVEEDAILFPRRFALNDEGSQPLSLADVAKRADGTPKWGILRGDTDQFELQLSRVATVEEHIHLSALFKEFFAGELALLCTLPDFWRKVTILYRGGDDFAVSGSWDALILLSHELERLFQKFVEQHLAALPGVEAKSLSMAVAIAPELDSAATTVFAQAGRELEETKATEPGSVHLFGRTLEWKRFADAEELKTSLVRMVRDFQYPPDYLNDLASVYREAVAGRRSRGNKAVRVDKPWRTYMRLSRVIPQARSKEQNNLRNAVITNLVGKRTAGVKLRPSARVGLEWARLAARA